MLSSCTMQNIKDRLRDLLNKSELTIEEKEWLSDYLTNPNNPELQELLREDFDAGVAETGSDTQGSAQILPRIHERIGVGNNNGRVAKMGFVRLVAAACVLGAMIFIGYRASHVKEPGVLKSRTAKLPPLKDAINPGTNKAILTLADGSTIVLEKDSSGELAQQGSTTVLQLKGELTYKSANSSATPVMYNTIATPRGGQYKVILADGSIVWLNAASSLRFPTSFQEAERRVEITGEAYFEIAHNQKMPFIVSVNGAEIKVLGTHFNVMAYADEATITTTLLEGSVKFIKGNSEVKLLPGQQSQLKKTGDVRVFKDVDVDRFVAWKNGYFHFNGEDIGTVTRQLSRWYDVEVENEGLINDRFYAEIPRNTKLMEALKALELTGKVRFVVEGKKIIVK